MTIANEQMIEHISKMSVLDLANLVKELEEKFGVSAAPVAVAGAGGAAESAEEKTEFNVVLAEIGPKKINVIKEIRAITGLGLKEAKDLVEGAPKNVKEAIEKSEAEEIKKKLEAVGAKVELK
ncbi:MAG: 50S ribosomal protein L7/L12 [Bacteriovoracaceae bacterium]|nr:50S ribosomal protein L7/L12 [Bacteriovoracaceae bacterium]